MRIDILNFILKLEIIIPYEHRNKEEIWIIDILPVICMWLEQRKTSGLKKIFREEFEGFRDEIYRFNLEQGQYLEPLQSKST
jgi:hypothetical protein